MNYNTIEPNIEPNIITAIGHLGLYAGEKTAESLIYGAKTLFDPFFFFKQMQKKDKKETEEEKYKRYSHIYLGKIKHLREEHKREKERLRAKITELKDRIDSLQIALSSKITKEVIEKIELDKRAIEVNHSTIANFKYLRRNTLEYVLGHDEKSNLLVGDLSKDAQLLISGRTGSGKTVTTLNILMSIAHNNTPKTLKISLIDPKILTFGDHRVEKSPFLNEKPSIGDNERAFEIISNAYEDMMKRYKLMRKAGVKDYRKIGLHSHVIFIDEVFELLEGKNAKEILSLLTRIASLGRAGGVHLVLATQSPRAKTLSGTLKANLCFIGHKMSNSTESTLIGLKEAHNLRGRGDGLREINGEVVRFQATFLDEELDESYATLNPSHPSHIREPKTTPHAPNTDPSRQPLTHLTHTEKQAFKTLLEDIIKTVNEKGKIKPKSYFFTKRSRNNDKTWDKAINLLHKEKELIYFKNGIGYFLNVDYSTALNILEEG